MANTVTERTGLAIDTRDFANLSRALRKASPELAAEFRGELRAIGQIVADEAKRIAEESSESIPPTIRVSVRLATVSVLAGDGENAIAGLFELGNKGGGKSQAASKRGTFRHPVFGNRDVWVNQDMHPYEKPAQERTMAQVDAALLQVLDSTARSITTSYV